MQYVVLSQKDTPMKIWALSQKSVQKNLNGGNRIHWKVFPEGPPVCNKRSIS